MKDSKDPQLRKSKKILTFTSPGKNKSKPMKREEYFGKLL
jgi:hypothetical protein